MNPTNATEISILFLPPPVEATCEPNYYKKMQKFPEKKTTDTYQVCDEAIATGRKTGEPESPEGDHCWGLRGLGCPVTGLGLEGRYNGDWRPEVHPGQPD